MADAPDDAHAPEGWQVPQRKAMIAAVSFPLALLTIVLVGGWFYERDVAPGHRAPVTTFPAPGLETAIHDGALDPERPPLPTRPDPAIAAAKRAQIERGWQ